MHSLFAEVLTATYLEQHRTDVDSRQRFDDADVQQAVRKVRVRRDQCASPCALAVGNGEQQHLALQIELRAAKARGVWVQVGQLAQPAQRVGQHTQRCLGTIGRVRGHFGGNTADGHVEVAPVVRLRGVDSRRRVSQHYVHCVVRIVGYIRLTREVIGGSERNDAQRHVASRQSVDHLVDRSIAPRGKDRVVRRFGLRGSAGITLGVAPFPGDAHIDGVSLLAHPLDEVAHGWQVRTRAM